VGEEFADDSIIVLRLAHELLEDARLLLARMGARMVSNASLDTSRVEECNSRQYDHTLVRR
jgi:hypothetical protein